MTTAPGWLASPQYPRPFGSPAECRWHLSLPAAANSTTLVTFTAFSLYDIGIGDCIASSISVTPGQCSEGARERGRAAHVTAKK